MWLRNRLILVVLLVALMPLILLTAQACSISIKQQAGFQEEFETFLSKIPDNSSMVDAQFVQEKVLQWIDQNQQNSASMRFSLLLVSVSLGLISVILAVVLARILTVPVDVLAENAKRALNSILGILGNKRPPERKDALQLANFVLDIVETRLAGYISHLEKQLGAHAEEIKRRSEMLSEIVKVFERLKEIQNLEVLVQEAVQQIASRFTLYHAGVYLLDSSGEQAVLQAVDRGVGSQRMLQSGYRVRVGKEGIVGSAAALGQIVYVPDVQMDSRYLPNIHLPAARAEMAIPLIAKGRVAGVLDAQSTISDGFDQETRDLLILAAGYLSLLIENLRLVGQLKDAQEAERRAYTEITRSGWRNFLRTRRRVGYRANDQGVFPADDGLAPWIKEALERNEVVIAKDPDHVDLAIPIKVRDETLGVIDFRKTGQRADWTEEERFLVQTLTEHLGQALESARLYQNAQLRAERERILSEITGKVRASTNIQTILQTAVKELAEVLRVPKGVIELGVEDGGKTNE